MKTLIQGKIENFVPFFNAYVNKKNALVLTKNDGDFCMTVDTGFSGGIALSADIIENMSLKLATFDTFTLATVKYMGSAPIYRGQRDEKNIF